MNAVLTPSTWLQRLSASYNKQRRVEPAWLMTAQEKQWEMICRTGLPTRKDERWKYTDLALLTTKDFSPLTIAEANHFSTDAIQQHRLQAGESILLVFINGFFMPTLSDMAMLPSHVTACSLHEALQTHAHYLQPYWSQLIDSRRYPFASLNAVMSTDGLFFHLPAHGELGVPLHLLSIVTHEGEFIAQPRHLFMLGEQSKLLVVEEQLATAEQTYLSNNVSTIVLENGAQLEQVKIQHESRHALQLSHYFVHQKQYSTTSFTTFSLGAAFARDELIVQLQEPGANCRTSGFYHLRDDNQYIDHHIDINHLAAHSTSEMLYKGVLEKKSRGVFNGRLHVEKNAQKILAYQANHTILLAKEAEMYTKPELEIYADEVRCKHGASIGQLNQDALFYLCSRGIEKTEAMTMLLRGFADEVLQRVKHEGIQMRIRELM